jgi:DNA-binding response OmpR family regulator
MRLVIADPEPIAADLLVFAAQRRGHQACTVSSVPALFDRLPFEPVVAIISLPDIDAASVAAIARVKERLPDIGIFLICEQSTALPAIAALKAGAHDVIYSPYNPFEVLIRAEGWVASRGTVAGGSSALKLGDIELDLDAYRAIKNGQALPLTRLERRLLYCLCQHMPNVATIDRLLAFGWDALDDPDTGLLKTHISHIRRKLRDAGGQQVEIISHQAVGYSMRLVDNVQLAS